MSPRTRTTRRTSVGRRHPRAVRRLALGTTGALLAGAGMFAGITSASAAVPTFPDNLLVFPNRDFVSVEGYSEYAGQTATIEITRNGVGLVGSSTATVSGTDVAFEVNHPGGVCWGNGTAQKVTPDIVAGDLVTISIGGHKVGETTVQDAAVTGSATVNGNTLTVSGNIAGNVAQANTEQRIIAPDLRTTAINRRDIRALPGNVVPAPRGGYSSGMTFDDAAHTFTATYVFDNPAWAAIARDSALGPRMMSWEVVDFAGNRQGVTIAEFGELGGPGMGGCPNGPASSGPVGPTNIIASYVPGGVRLTWNPAVALAGTEPITGYRVTAVNTVPTGSDALATQKRVSGQASTGTTLTGLGAPGTYTLEVESVSRVGVTTPAIFPDLLTDIVKPTITASPAGGTFTTTQSVTLTSDEPGTDIYYSLDGTEPVVGELLSTSTSVVHYTAPIAVSANATVKYAGFDPAGNVGTGEQTYTFTAAPPAAPANVAATIATTTATVTWTAADSLATSFIVQPSTSGPVAAPAAVTVPATQTTVAFPNLAVGQSYTFTVTASNANGASDSAISAPVTPVAPPPPPSAPVVANAGPDQTVTRATTPTTVTLTSAGSTATGVTYAWTQLSPVTSPPTTDPDKVTLTGAGSATATFPLPVYKFPMTNKPLKFQLTVTKAAAGSEPQVVKTDEVVINLRTDTVQFATAKWKAGDFRITGGGSNVAGTITLHSGSMTGPVLGTAFQLTPAVAPATGGTFDLRLRGNLAPGTAPATIWMESNLGGVAGPFTVG